MDPLLSHMGVLLRRSTIFVALVAVQMFALWVWFWMHFQHAGFQEAARLLVEAWPLDSGKIAAALALALLWTGCANTAIIYLVLGRWWKKRADILHRRGSRFVDEREEK